MKFIDLHCHILPQVDDGSSSPEETREMFTTAAKNGVKVIAATSHSSAVSVTKYREIFSEWQKIAAEEYAIKLVAGLEYDYTDLIKLRQKNAEEDLVLLNGKTTLLVDFALGYLPSDWTNLTNWSQAKQVRQIIAVHPERLFFDAVTTGNELMEAGIGLQVNAGSLLGDYGPKVRHQAYRLLDNGLCHFIAGDTHSARRPVWRMSAVYDKLLKRYGAECTNAWLNDNPQRIINGNRPHRVLPKLKWYQKLWH
ncbi:MAG: PHP domain-containing protein [Victivallales bacterium]|nr:PHP domain-containing protein [Victivallales bacterium]